MRWLDSFNICINCCNENKQSCGPQVVLKIKMYNIYLLTSNLLQPLLGRGQFIAEVVFLLQRQHPLLQMHLTNMNIRKLILIS